MLIPVLIVYFIIYFFLFRFVILKWDLKTPGREEGEEVGQLVSKEAYRQATGVGVAGGTAALPADFDAKSATILRGVGGVANLLDIDCCATRLRLTLNDSSVVDQPLLKTTGATGVVIKGNGIQVIYGPSVTIVKSNFEEFVEQVRSGQIPESLFMGAPAAASDALTPAEDKPHLPDAVFGAFANGEMKLMCEVEDEAFSACALGDGVAIEPSEGLVYAPTDATVSCLFDTKHAIGLATEGGADILLHIGIDTVALKGQYFEYAVSDDQEVKKGDLLVKFDIDAVKAAGYKCTIPMIICNTDDYAAVRPLKTGAVQVGDNLLEVKG